MEVIIFQIVDNLLTLLLICILLCGIEAKHQVSKHELLNFLSVITQLVFLKQLYKFAVGGLILDGKVIRCLYLLHLV